MKAVVLLGTIAVLAAGTVLVAFRPGQGAAPLAHASNTFSFTVAAPYATVFPLFGADKERAWSEGWAPEFIHPSPAQDTAGMVFTVPHGHTRAVWVNTAFDAATGHVQYVYVLGELFTALIDIHVTASSGSSTAVRVTYERTALSPGANEHVRQLGEQDRTSGPRWAAEIGKYVGRR